MRNEVKVTVQRSRVGRLRSQIAHKYASFLHIFNFMLNMGFVVPYIGTCGGGHLSVGCEQHPMQQYESRMLKSRVAKYTGHLPGPSGWPRLPLCQWFIRLNF